MKMFSTQFYALVGLVFTIVSLAITVSIAHANAQNKLKLTGKILRQAKPVKIAGVNVRTQRQFDPQTSQKPLPNGEKPRCLGLVSADFTSRNGRSLKMRAIRAWRKKVAIYSGKDYRHWSVSQKHTVSCQGRGRQRSCTASAFPCRIIKW